MLFYAFFLLFRFRDCSSYQLKETKGVQNNHGESQNQSNATRCDECWPVYLFLACLQINKNVIDYKLTGR